MALLCLALLGFAWLGLAWLCLAQGAKLDFVKICLGNWPSEHPKTTLCGFQEVAVAGGTGGPGFHLRVYKKFSENPSKQA